MCERSPAAPMETQTRAVICPQLHEAIYRDLRQASSDRPNHPSFSQSSRHTLFLNV